MQVKSLSVMSVTVILQISHTHTHTHNNEVFPQDLKTYQQRITQVIEEPVKFQHIFSVSFLS